MASSQVNDGTRRSDEVANEDTPLLINVTGEQTATSQDQEDDPRDKLRTRVTTLIFLILFTSALSLTLCLPAWNVWVEYGYCRQKYENTEQRLTNGFGDIGGVGSDNVLCKVDSEVQGNVAMLRGWMWVVESLPTLLLAVPLGSLSDLLGRKRILLLSWVGALISELWYDVVFFGGWRMSRLMLSGILTFPTGGIMLGISMLYTILADVHRPDELAITLARFQALYIVAELIGNPLSGYLLSLNPWYPLLLANALAVLSLFLVLLLPETLSIRRWHDAHKKSQGNAQDQHTTHTKLDDDEVTLRGALTKLVNSFAEVWIFILGNKTILALILPVTLVNAARFAGELSLQYSRNRYGWTWVQATYFGTLKSIGLIIFSTFILPPLSSFCLNRLKMNTLAKDVWLGRWMSAVLATGFLLIAFAFAPWIFAIGMLTFSCGVGLVPLLRSALNAVVEPHHVGTLNTLVGLLEVATMMLSAPGLSELLSKGIKLGGPWIGLPYLVAALVTCLGTAVLFTFRIPPPRVVEVQIDDDAGAGSDRLLGRVFSGGPEDLDAVESGQHATVVVDQEASGPVR